MYATGLRVLLGDRAMSSQLLGLLFVLVIARLAIVIGRRENGGSAT